MTTILTSSPSKTDVTETPIRTLMHRDPEEAFTKHLHRLTSEDIEYACLFHPSKILHFACNILNPEQFDYCCQRDTRCGLVHFNDRMTDKLFATCLKYDWVSALCWLPARLTEKQFARLVRQYPHDVLCHPNCHEKLTIKHLDYLIRQCPSMALEYAEYLLTDHQFEYCSRRAPQEAMEYCGFRLKKGLLRYCCLREPAFALENMLMSMPPKLLDECCSLARDAALEYAYNRMTPKRRADCVRKEPWVALQYVPDRLKPAQLVRLASAHTQQIEEFLSLYPDSKLRKALVPILGKLDATTRAVVATFIAKCI